MGSEDILSSILQWITGFDFVLKDPVSRAAQKAGDGVSTTTVALARWVSLTSTLRCQGIHNADTQMQNFIKKEEEEEFWINAECGPENVLLSPQISWST